jgi:hypothetical protein
MNQTFKPNQTLRFTFKDGDQIDVIRVEVENSERLFAWRMIVNGEASPIWYRSCILVSYGGYYVASETLDSIFPTFIPFKIVPATQA